MFVCVPCCVADGWGHAAVHRQPEGASDLRAGPVEWWRGDQPGEGGLCKLHSNAVFGFRAEKIACRMACEAVLSLAVFVVEAFGWSGMLDRCRSTGDAEAS